MQKSVLNLYLQRVAEGDQSYTEKLCSRLADRLVYIPILDAGAHQQKNDGALTTVHVLQINEAKRSLVPLFTNERQLKTWSTQSAHSGKCITLLGADFCAALGEQTWLLIDPGSENKLELPPEIVSKISKSGYPEGFAEQQHSAASSDKNEIAADPTTEKNETATVAFHTGTIIKNAGPIMAAPAPAEAAAKVEFSGDPLSDLGAKGPVALSGEQKSESSNHPAGVKSWDHVEKSGAESKSLEEKFPEPAANGKGPTTQVRRRRGLLGLFRGEDES